MSSGRIRHFFRALGQRQRSRPWRGLSCKTALLSDHRSWSRRNGVFLNFSTSSLWFFRQPHGENANFARARPAVFHFCVHLFTEWAYLLVREWNKGEGNPQNCLHPFDCLSCGLLCWFLQMLIFARARLPFSASEAKGEGNLLLFPSPLTCSHTVLCRGEVKV